MRSLSERVADLATELTGPVAEPIEEVYVRLFRETFGRRPFLRSKRSRDVLARVAESCAEASIDVETYIAGNLWAMKAWADANPRIGFQPTHLSGENALRRYHAYLGRISRRFRTAKHRAAGGESDAAKLRRCLFLGEYAVAEEFVARFVTAGRADWNAAVAAADPNKSWLGLERAEGAAYRRACSLLGAGGLRREREFARLRAASALAEKYQHGLADRVGFSRFTWQAFAALVRRVVGPPRKRRTLVALADVEGLAWR